MLKVTNLDRLSAHGLELSGISFTIKRGETVVIVGPNGAGKSALLETIAATERPYEGQVLVNHFDTRREPDKAKLQFGYVPSPFEPELYLTGFEYLHLAGAFHHLAGPNRIKRILELAKLFRAETELYSLLERGEAALWQRIGLMASLLHEPPLLLWDEPTAHLDETGRHTVVALLKDRASRGASALVATNDLALAEQIADRLIILVDGQLVGEGTLTQLSHHLGAKVKDLPALYDRLLP